MDENNLYNNDVIDGKTLQERRREASIKGAIALAENFKNNEQRYKDDPKKVEELREYTLKRFHDIFDSFLKIETVDDIPEIVEEMNRVRTNDVNN